MTQSKPNSHSDRKPDSEKGRSDHLSEHNVQRVARLEKEALVQRTFGNRVADWITGALGSPASAVVHFVWFGGWIGANTGLIPGLPRFDPFPFGLLTTIVSLEAIFLSIFVLITQNRMSHQQDQRAHLDLQLDMLAEQENTLMLKMQRRICDHLGLAPDDEERELHELMEKTDVRRLMHEIEHDIPE